jgi:hypothetical protein
MILHLTDDQKFINGAYDMFEKYYPGLNHFFIQVPRKEKGVAQNVNKRERLFFIALTEKKELNLIYAYARKNNIKHVLIHYLNPNKAAIANHLKKHLGAKTYWLFYGSDLYSRLFEEGKYELHDDALMNKRVVHYKKSIPHHILFYLLHKQSLGQAFRQFVKELDFFCFWNIYDYRLLQLNYTTKAEHKTFFYYHMVDRKNYYRMPEKSLIKVMVNHSASRNGNHKTVLSKLKRLDDLNQISKIFAPLSYGDSNIRSEVILNGTKDFGVKFIPIIKFMPVDEYYQFLDEISVAIFGNRRQEGGGNVFYLLSIGVKVFLRNENNMIQYLRDQGFKVFSFEDDLNSTEDLKPLTEVEMKTNFNAYVMLFSQQQETLTMQKLIAQC